MLSRTLIGFILLFPLLYLQARPDSPPLSTFQGTLSEAQVAAKVANQPLLVYLHDPEDAGARRMKRDSWDHPEVRTLLHDHYVVFFLPLNEGEQPESLRHPIEELPTLLFVHPQGQLMGSVEGYVAPKSLGHMLRRYQQRVHPPQVTHFAVKRPAPSYLALEPTRPAAAAYELSVAGLETYSLSRLSLPQDQNRPQLGLLAGSYDEITQLQRAMRRMERIWPGEMYVYAERYLPSDPPVYKLVLGAFDDELLAQRYAEAMVRYAQVEVGLLDLTPLVR